MQQQVGKVEAARIKPVQLLVKHERNPCYGNVQAAMVRREGPFYGCQTDSCMDVDIIDNIMIVIQIDEIERGDLPENSDGHNRQGQVNQRSDFPGRVRCLRHVDHRALLGWQAGSV